MLLPAGAQAASHCSAQERTLFSCSVGRKLLSICASPQVSADAGFVQYRFGPLGGVELAYPPIDADWRAFTRSGLLTYSAGGGAYLVFTRAPYRYVVYTAIGSGWGHKAGVVVHKHQQRIAHLPCRSDANSALGPELFADFGIAADQEAFDLP